MQNRTDTFDENSSCTTQGNTYEDNVNALLSYRTSINTIVNDIVSVPFDAANPLQSYEDNYYAYYTDVQNFFNDGVTGQFASFFDPYDSLYEGSSCGFVTTSMNGIINIGCNQLFPYFNIVSALTITISVVVFILLILAYFLTTRFQFFEFLDGNLDNWGEESYRTKDLPGYNMDSTRNYNQELMTQNTGRY